MRSPSKENLLMIARTASLDLHELIVDVDTQELRSSARSPPSISPPAKSPVQVRAFLSMRSFVGC